MKDSKVTMSRSDLDKAIIDEDTTAITSIIFNNRKLLSRLGNCGIPLWYAIYNGKLKSVKKLIELGADITEVSKKKNTVLHCAVFANNIDVLKWLWDRVPLSFHQMVDNDGNTPLNYVAQNGNYEAVKFLLAHVKYVDRKIFRFLNLENILNAGTKQQTGLPAIIDFDLVKLLIVRGASVTNTVIKLANSDAITDQWRRWCETQKIFHKPLIDCIKDWQSEYQAFVTNTYYEVPTAGELEQIMYNFDAVDNYPIRARIITSVAVVMSYLLQNK